MRKFNLAVTTLTNRGAKAALAVLAAGTSLLVGKTATVPVYAVDCDSKNLNVCQKNGGIYQRCVLDGTTYKWNDDNTCGGC